jgi:uncharacterized membrane protein YedE/YeeE
VAHSFITSRPRLQFVVVAAALVLATFGGSFVVTNGWRSLLLWIIGLALGYVLYRGTFGFAAGFRALLRDGRTAHVRAQLLMIAAAALLFLPALDIGSVASQPVRGFVFPAGTAVALGAFLFGIGMQLGGGCASGTLYSAGGGSPRMLITLAFMIAGATLAAFHADWWTTLPALPALSLLNTFGLALVLALYALIGTLLWIAALSYERRRHGSVQPIWQRHDEARSYGAWPYAWAALALALLNFATLAIAGRPWGVSQAFALWGSKVLEATGLSEPAFWAFWEQPSRAAALHRSLWADTTSIMDIAVMVGALLAAGVAARFAPQWRIAPGHLLASVIGGLLLGIGAIIATGCNISAMFSGIASGSLHGWLWLASALLGNWLGLTLRPLFRLDQPPITHRTVLQTT